MFSKPTADTINSALPWVGGGAGLGAALGAGSYALQDEEEKKHNSLLKSMALMAGMGGLAGGGLKALGGLANPETLKTTSILPQTPPPVSGARGTMALLGSHPGLTGAGAAGATAVLGHKPINTAIENMNAPLKATAENAHKALGKARVDFAQKPGDAALGTKVQQLEALAKGSKPSISLLRKLLMKLGIPAAAGGAAYSVAGAGGDLMQNAEAYNAALRQHGGKAGM